MLVETVVSVDGIELASVSTTTTSNQTSNRQKELTDNYLFWVRFGAARDLNIYWRFSNWKGFLACNRY